MIKKIKLSRKPSKVYEQTGEVADIKVKGSKIISKKRYEMPTDFELNQTHQLTTQETIKGIEVVRNIDVGSLEHSQSGENLVS